MNGKRRMSLAVKTDDILTVSAWVVVAEMFVGVDGRSLPDVIANESPGLIAVLGAVCLVNSYSNGILCPSKHQN
ncbi:hypothetical protein [Pararhizobium sp. A13]|uniref:hypothetical protein n=1 Tax=Pararhizobium sp. A13 TaxID=3133975 RepID=UPI00311B1664